LHVVVVFELGGRVGYVEFVEEAAVVEPVDPFQCGQFEVVETSPWSPIANEFGLVEPD